MLNRFVSKILAFVWIVGMCFGMSGAFSASTSNLRAMDGSLGILRQPVTKAGKILKKYVYKALFAPVKAEAQLGVLLSGIGSSVFEALFKVITDLVLKVIDTIMKPIMSFLDNIFSFFDKFLELLEKLADFISATRVGLAFKVFEKIQNDTNIKSSKEFAEELVFQAQGVQANLLPADFLSIIVDSIAWLDFMSAQKALQADVIGDVLAQVRKTIGIRPDELQDIKYNLVNLVTGAQCDRNNFVKSIGVFGPLFAYDSPCFVERGSEILNSIQQRESSIAGISTSSVTQLDNRAPSDCKARQYIKVDNVPKLNYTSGSGGLSERILEVSKEIEVINPSIEECETAKNGKNQIRESSSSFLDPINVAIAGVTGGGAFEVALSALTQTIGGQVKKLEESITSRFGKAIDIIRNLNFSNFGLNIVAAEISLSVRGQIKKELEEQQDNYQGLLLDNYPNGQTPSTIESTGNVG